MGTQHLPRRQRPSRFPVPAAVAVPAARCAPDRSSRRPRRSAVPQISPGDRVADRHRRQAGWRAAGQGRLQPLKPGDLDRARRASARRRLARRRELRIRQRRADRGDRRPRDAVPSRPVEDRPVGRCRPCHGDACVRRRTQSTRRGLRRRPRSGHRRTPQPLLGASSERWCQVTMVSGIEEVRHRMFERRVHALIVAAALLLVALILGIVVAVDPSASAVQGIDDWWMRQMIAIRTPLLTRIAKGMSMLGSVVVTLPIRIVVSLLLAYHRRWLQLGAFLGAVITSELCIGPLKALVDRPRPPNPMIATTGASFPSGHAIAGAVSAFGLVVVLWPASSRRLTAIGCAAAFAGLMAISRTYLAAHWLTDTIAGVCIGTGLALMWPAALEIARERRGRRVALGADPSPSSRVVEEVR